jgi:ubiquinone/menaquinone biosynthesis C-methylase UbiE
MTDSESIPQYAPELDAYHRAHALELKCVIKDLPLHPGDKVLDLACGDGAYATWLAERAGPHGLVVGADASHVYLQRALDAEQATGPRFVASVAETLPFADNTFDLVWCAQSFVSLPSPLAALREMRRVVKPQGVVAVMENDSLHQMILPWPADLELAVRQAELLAYRADSGQPGKCYIARQLSRLLRSAGLASVRRKTYSTDRSAPLDKAEEELLRQYLEGLGRFVLPFLREPYRSQFVRTTDANAPTYIARQEGFEMTWLDVVCCGRKPLPRIRAAKRAPSQTGKTVGRWYGHARYS